MSRESQNTVHHTKYKCTPRGAWLLFGVQGAKLNLANNLRENTMNLQDVLNKVCGDLSDNQTSIKLGITRSTFSAYRVGRKNPSDDVLDRMIDMSGLNPVEVYLAAYAEKVHNPTVAAAFRSLAA